MRQSPGHDGSIRKLRTAVLFWRDGGDPFLRRLCVCNLLIDWIGSSRVCRMLEECECDARQGKANRRGP